MIYLPPLFLSYRKCTSVHKFAVRVLAAYFTPSRDLRIKHCSILLFLHSLLPNWMGIHRELAHGISFGPDADKGRTNGITLHKVLNKK